MVHLRTNLHVYSEDSSDQRQSTLDHFTAFWTLKNLQLSGSRVFVTLLHHLQFHDQHANNKTAKDSLFLLHRQPFEEPHRTHKFVRRQVKIQTGTNIAINN